MQGQLLTKFCDIFWSVLVQIGLKFQWDIHAQELKTFWNLFLKGITGLRDSKYQRYSDIQIFKLERSIYIYIYIWERERERERDREREKVRERGGHEIERERTI